LAVGAPSRYFGRYLLPGRQGFTYRWLRRENIARAADLVGTLKM
jgi:hypothetical protein